MASNNQFRIIGICYGDSKRELTNHKTPRTFVSIVVKSALNRKGTHIFPIYFYGDLADKAQFLCRNGCKVAVVGEMVSLAHTYLETGETKVEIRFIGTELIRLTKPTQTTLTNKRFTDLVELANVDKYEPPKPRVIPRKEENNGK